MSKVSFRARALDASKPMPVYKACEIPDMKDFAQINRSVPQMPTGMEKEEEAEHHLQRALSAQQVYGSSEALVIPIPEVQDIAERYHVLYPSTYKTTKQYIHIQAFNMDQEIPDYDMDSDDDTWLTEHSKKMEITPLKFEEMMDRLEKGSGQQVVTLREAKLLLKDDDDLIMAVYDYWLNKRLTMQRPLIATVKSEKRDGTTTNNPYVAFRRRTEKMQTRKNRKNDEVSYEKMHKLRRDLQKTLTLLELLKRREKSKKELLQLTIEILEKRNEMEDFSGTALVAAEEEREKHPTFVAPFALNSLGEWVQTFQGEEVAPVRKKRQYRKRKQSQQQQQQQQQQHPAGRPGVSLQFQQQQQQQQHSSGEVDIMDSSDEDLLSPALSQSDHEDENDPDGIFAFKRRKNCHYHQPIQSGIGNWPWHGPEEGGRGDKRFRFSLTSLPSGFMGYARRRIGRGGRVIFDRASTDWDDTLERLDCGHNSHSSLYSDYIMYVRGKKIPHYRPKTPPAYDPGSSPPAGQRGGAYRSSYSSHFSHRDSSAADEFDVESFHWHQEQLLEMQREQQHKLFTEDNRGSSVNTGLTLGGTLSGETVFVGSGDSSAAAVKGSTDTKQGQGLSTLTPTLSSLPRFTLDSAGAEFAVRALVESPGGLTVPPLEASTPAVVAASPVGSRTSLQQPSGTSSSLLTSSISSLTSSSTLSLLSTSASLVSKSPSCSTTQGSGSSSNNNKVGITTSTVILNSTNNGRTMLVTSNQLPFSSTSKLPQHVSDSSTSDSSLISGAVTRLPLLPSTSGPTISLIHKSASAPILPHINAASSTSLLSPLITATPTTTSLLTSQRVNGPSSTATHVKSSGLSTSPAASVLQLNFPACNSTSLLTPIAQSLSSQSSSSSLLNASSPAVVMSMPSSSSTSTPSQLTAAITPTSLLSSSPSQLQQRTNLATPKHLPAGSTGALYKLPASAAPSSNFDILRPNHEEILFNKDKGIPMDVT
ncbi:enhancer of polycomb-like protein [Elysia marginata]|uniref:Enhancer of polycomb-like protein n=1 Tax=Elysia marginata TaxID=1093978 RepID=A0AAV4I505_9GAST|nr:enhancer of polycomb-like protein [Elysia marginata]